MYDPMVAKLIVWDVDREQATARMLRALRRVRDRGAEDAVALPHRRSSRPGSGHDAETCRDLIEDRKWLKSSPSRRPDEAGEDEDEAETVEQSYTVEVSGKRFDVKVIGPPFAGAAVNGAAPAAASEGAAARRPRAAARAHGAAAAAGAATRSPRRFRAPC